MMKDTNMGLNQMTDDIVTRLRDRAKERIEANEEYWRGHKFEYEIPILEDQAADEIERLRAELKRWQDCEMVVESLCGWDSEETYCNKCKEAYEEMMTND